MNYLEILSVWAAGGMGAGGGFFAFKWLIEYIGGRMDKRADALDTGTQRLIDNMQKQINSLVERLGSTIARLDHVEEELRDCREKHAQASGELAQLKGVMQGLGDARGTAAMIVAADRLKDKADD